MYTLIITKECTFFKGNIYIYQKRQYFSKNQFSKLYKFSVKYILLWSMSNKYVYLTAFVVFLDKGFNIAQFGIMTYFPNCRVYDSSFLFWWRKIWEHLILNALANKIIFFRKYISIYVNKLLNLVLSLKNVPPRMKEQWNMFIFCMYHILAF